MGLRAANRFGEPDGGRMRAEDFPPIRGRQANWNETTTLAWIDDSGKTTIDYRPVHDYTP